MDTNINKSIELLRTIDWSSPPHVAEIAGHALQTLSERQTLKKLIDATCRDQSLLGLCEHYDLLDKIVLHNDPSGFRLRLHIFLPGYYDRPHNHRWSYASLILHGRYRHDIYGTDSGLSEEIDPSRLTPLQSRYEGEGSSYALHDSMVHAVIAEPYTVTLIVRGPAVKERFLVMDRITNQAWWQFGAAAESQAALDEKRMSWDYFQSLIKMLETKGII